MAAAAETIQALGGEFLALTEISERLSQVFERLLGAPESLIEVTCVRDDENPTPDAVKLLLGAQASEGSLVLLAALRAGNVHLRVVELALSHLTPPVSSPEATVAAPAGRVPSPCPTLGGVTPDQGRPSHDR